MEIVTQAAQFPEKEYINGIFLAVKAKGIQRVYAQTTYNQENLAFCFQLCTVAHFVGFLLLPWFSSSLVFFPYSCFGGFCVSYVLRCKTFKVICVSPFPSCHPPSPISEWLWKNEGTCFSPTFPFLWWNRTCFGLEDSIFLSVKQPAHVQRFCVIHKVCNGCFLFPCLKALSSEMDPAEIRLIR